MRNSPIPEKAKIQNSNGYLTPAWAACIETQFKKLGASTGDVILENNRIHNISDDGDLNIAIDKTITINDTSLPEILVNDYVFFAIDGDTKELELVDATDAGLSPDTGIIQLGIFSSTPTGWISFNDGTIGNASSGASNRANADTLDLFTVLWNAISNTYCPVSSGRGVSAATDFAANKTIQLPRACGRIIGQCGAGSGLTVRALGEYLGTETVTLSTSQIPAHTHSTPLAAGHDGSQNGSGFTMNIAQPTTTSMTPTGGGGAHNNMQPTTFWDAIIKL
jgi:hypothetical protein